MKQNSKNYEEIGYCYVQRNLIFPGKQLLQHWFSGEKFSDIHPLLIRTLQATFVIVIRTLLVISFISPLAIAIAFTFDATSRFSVVSFNSGYMAIVVSLLVLNIAMDALATGSGFSRALSKSARFIISSPMFIMGVYKYIFFQKPSRTAHQALDQSWLTFILLLFANLVVIFFHWHVRLTSWAVLNIVILLLFGIWYRISDKFPIDRPSKTATTAVYLLSGVASSFFIVRFFLLHPVFNETHDLLEASYFLLIVALVFSTLVQHILLLPGKLK